MKYEENALKPKCEPEQSKAQEMDVEIKSYEKPVLISYGDVRDITLGPTIGEGESGCAFLFRSGPGGCP